ncbi:Rab2b [Hexamita inflata]|uniref:Rab2b n=1 Tax=Hexamita inflata TaxID=28002 RepID=A0AA86TKY5_9EUKA|nr:Rab2b [Hexamita inflata]
MLAPQIQVDNHSFKIMITGPGATGKSTILKIMKQQNYQQQSYQQTQQIMQDNLLVDVKLAGNQYSVKLNVWDIPGQFLAIPVSQSYFRNANVLLFIYDSTSMKSFTEIVSQYHKLSSIAPDSLKYLIGTKIDLDSPEKQSVQAEAETFSAKHSLKTQKVNCQMVQQILDLLNQIAKDAMRNKLGWSEELDDDSYVYGDITRQATRIFEYKRSGLISEFQTLINEPDVMQDLTKKEAKGCCK